MKQIIYLFTSFVLLSCGQENLEEDLSDVSTSTIGNNTAIIKVDSPIIDSHSKKAINGFDKALKYKFTDTIKADLNGDGILDLAFYKKEKHTSGITIRHGGTKEEISIGFGKEFDVWTGLDFNWADYWGLVEDKETSQTIFSEEGDILESRTVKLQNPSIVLGEYEVGGGLITFINGKYVWIHQTC